MYKIETHLHTCHSSPCGKEDAQTIVRLYAEAGYSGIIVTDHFFRYTCRPHVWNIPYNQFFARFIEGYHHVCRAAEPYGLKIYKGAEVRFDESTNDYLLYNYPDELLADPDAIFSMDLDTFYPLCQQAGALLIQAHPFRGTCTPVDPRFIDGIEVYNLKARGDSQNHLSVKLAQENPQFITTSGSDFHYAEDAARGGIITPSLPEDEAALVSLLRSQSHLPIGPEHLEK